MRKTEEEKETRGVANRGDGVRLHEGGDVGEGQDAQQEDESTCQLGAGGHAGADATQEDVGQGKVHGKVRVRDEVAGQGHVVEAVRGHGVLGPH